MKIPNKLLNLSPYDPADNKPRIKLDANESFLTPPAEIARKIQNALAEVSLNRYPDSLAADVCCEAAKLYGADLEQIVTSNGSDEMISILFNSFLEKGDRVLIADPDFSMYRFYAYLAETEVITIEKQQLQIDADEVIRTAREKDVSVVIFSNPCNPTGTGLSRDNVLKIVRSLDCLVIVDEAYMEFWDQSIIRDVSSYSNVIVMRTCSKALGLAGIRLGFAVSNQKLIDYIKAAKSPFNVNSLTQAAALAVLREKEYINACTNRIISSKNALYYGLKKLENEHSDICVYNTVSNFVLIKSKIAGKLQEALSKCGVSIRKIMGDYLRITAGSDFENAEVVRLISENV